MKETLVTFRDKLCALMHKAAEILRQMHLEAPRYWDGAAVTAMRIALAALVLMTAAMVFALAANLITKKIKWIPVLSCAAVLSVCGWLCYSVYRPVPVLPEGEIKAVTVTALEDKKETALRLQSGMKKQLKTVLTSAQCRRSAVPKLPDAKSTLAYRIECETEDGTVSILATESKTVRFMESAEKSLVCPVQNGEIIYQLLLQQE